DRAPEKEAAWESLAENHTSEDRDQDRTDVHEHCRGPRVDAPLSRVQHDAVETEPEDAAEGDLRKVASSRQRLAAHQREPAERRAADEQSPERERAGREMVSRGADADERGGPEGDGQDRRGRGEELPSLARSLARRVESRHLD